MLILMLCKYVIHLKIIWYNLLIWLKLHTSNILVSHTHGHLKLNHRCKVTDKFLCDNDYKVSDPIFMRPKKKYWEEWENQSSAVFP